MKEFPGCKISLKRMEGHDGPLHVGNCRVFLNDKETELPIRKITFDFGGKDEKGEIAIVNVEFQATEIELEGVTIQGEAVKENKDGK